MARFKESLRKSIHLGSLVIPFGYRYILNFNRKQMFYIVLILFIVMLIIEFYRFWQKSFKKTFWWIFGLVLRRHELRDFTGATYLLFASVICVAFFPPWQVFFALSFLAIGDTFAAMVGMNLGKRKISKGRKSLEGSIACFVSCFIFALVFGLHPLLALVGALAASLAELSPLPLDDNIKMPLASAVAMALFNIFI
ncbi:MAG: phosphatidate cytidylyltransferase [Candidatus Cloacimonetes bacterium]|nr:phosphatidate cytidylyltransferase [Candidatus Cloacimonadota bacterium]